MTVRTTIDELAGWLKAQDEIVLLGHVSPDGDAAGSCLAIWHALRTLNKRVTVCLPGGIPRLYASLPGAEAVLETGAKLPFTPKAALAVDVSEHGRLGDAGAALFDACPNQAVLDHHPTNAGFGQWFALDGAAAATGELALALIEAMGLTLDRKMAECLFVAISTDCGHFNYSNTRPDTLRAAARCVEAGADVADITRRLYRTRSRGRTQLLGMVLSGLEVSADGRMAWARLTEEMLAQAGALPEDNEGIVNYLLEIKGVVFACLAEQRGTATKFSLRSIPPLDIANGVAVPLGGGGHECAAGCTLNLPMESALQRVLERARVAMADCGITAE